MSFWTRTAIYLDAHAQSLVLLIYTANVNQEVSNLGNVDWFLFFAFESYENYGKVTFPMVKMRERMKEVSMK